MSADRYAPVGAVVYSAFWRKRYTVLSHNADGSVTVRWEDSGPTTHRTPLEKHDRIVTGPPTPASPSTTRQDLCARPGCDTLYESYGAASHWPAAYCSPLCYLRDTERAAA